MCQEKKIFIFCTCQEEKQNNPKNVELLDNYSWALTKFLGLKETSIRGKIVMPKNDLGNGLTIENILNQLNNNIDSFDFEYSPTERDCLDINVSRPTERVSYFKISYRNGSWIEGGNPAFRTIYEKIADGKIIKTNTQ